MSCLLVDEGNTLAKYALCDETGAITTIDWPEIDFLSLTQIIFSSVKKPNDSVINQLQAAVQNANHAHLSIKQVETPAKAFGLINAYQDYKRLGVDRWLAMLAVKNFTSRGFIVIDAGTALTIDAVDRHGLHLGGWILPNVNLSAQSLIKRTDKIEIKQAAKPDINLGKVTESCIYNGLYASHICLIQSLVLSLSTDCQPEIWLTGGDSQIYKKLLAEVNISSQVESDLVFYGLRQYI
mgnify:CR=1 FL=1